MQALIVLNFFFLTLLFPFRNKKALLSDIITLALVLFPTRVLILCASILFIKNSSFLGLDYKSKNLLFINSTVFVLLFFATYKILMKSLIRNAELVSRFILDALPGEQLSVDIAKRDGIYSAKDALTLRSKKLMNSLGIASSESKLKILSYEPLIVLVVAIALSIIDIVNSNAGSDELIFQANSSLLISNMTYLSIILSTTLLFRSIENWDELNTYRILEIIKTNVKILSAYIFSFSLITFGFSFAFFGIGEAFSVSWAIFITSLALYSYHLISRRDVKNTYWLYDIQNESFKKIAEDHITKLGYNDLRINLHTSASEEDKREYIFQVIQYLRDRSLIFEPAEKIFLNFDVESKKDNLELSWRGREFQVYFNYSDKNDIVKNAISLGQKLTPLLAPFITKFHIHTFVKRNALTSTNFSIFSQLQNEDIQNIFEISVDLMKKGLFLDNYGMFIYNSLHEEYDYVKQYLSNNLQQMVGKDDRARVLFVNDIQASGIYDELESIISKVKQRGISPLIISADIEELPDYFKWFNKDCIILDKKLIPDNLSFFPLMSI